MITREAAHYNRTAKEFQCLLSNGEIISAQSYSATVALAEERLAELQAAEEAARAAITALDWKEQVRKVYADLVEQDRIFVYRSSVKFSSNVTLQKDDEQFLQNLGLYRMTSLDWGTKDGIDIVDVDDETAQVERELIASMMAPAAPAALPKPKKARKTKILPCKCPGCVQDKGADGIFFCRVNKEWAGFVGGQFICWGPHDIVEPKVANFRYETARRAA